MTTEATKPVSVAIAIPSKRDAIRNKVLAGRPKSTIVKLDDGTEIEVRQGRVGDMLDAITTEDPKKRMASLLILACYVPGTNEKVFDDTDYDTLMNLPSGGVFSQLTEAISSQNDLDKQVKKEGNV